MNYGLSTNALSVPELSSEYETKPTEHVLQSAFSDEKLLGNRQKNGSHGLKVAVVTASEAGTGSTMLPNYNTHDGSGPSVFGGKPVLIKSSLFGSVGLSGAASRKTARKYGRWYYAPRPMLQPCRLYGREFSCGGDLRIDIPVGNLRDHGLYEDTHINIAIPSEATKTMVTLDLRGISNNKRIFDISGIPQQLLPPNLVLRWEQPDRETQPNKSAPAILSQSVTCYAPASSRILG
ncbi:hypothetical protein ANO14919_052160 [Xylariales sp. No.14919]|nr:hypothetical protein ANO14919_052160 [Xylariales sp. No.14919]